MLTPPLEKTHHPVPSLRRTDFKFCVTIWCIEPEVQNEEKYDLDIPNTPTCEAFGVLEYFGLRVLNLYKPCSMCGGNCYDSLPSLVLGSVEGKGLWLWMCFCTHCSMWHIKYLASVEWLIHSRLAHTSLHAGGVSHMHGECLCLLENILLLCVYIEHSPGWRSTVCLGMSNYLRTHLWQGFESFSGCS